MPNNVHLETDAFDYLFFMMPTTTNVLYELAAINHSRMAWVSWEGRSKNVYLYHFKDAAQHLISQLFTSISSAFSSIKRMRYCY